MSSMYAKYIKERDNAEIIEDNQGFMSFKCIPEGLVIADMYVEKSFRNKKVAKKYYKQALQIAKERKIKNMYASIDRSTNGFEIPMCALVGWGFKLTTTRGNLVWFEKEIR